jgi:3-oxoadipate enol-lactonase
LVQRGAIFNRQFSVFNSQFSIVNPQLSFVIPKAMPYFRTADGCLIFYQTYDFASTKPVMICLNGLTQTTLYWHANLSAFRQKHRMLLYDARCQGYSEPGEMPLSLETHVADLKGLLDHLQVSQAQLVGLSHGARVALMFAVKYPAYVEHLVLAGIGADLSRRARLIVQSWQEILGRAGLETMAWAVLPVVFGEAYLERYHSILDKIVQAVVVRNRAGPLLTQLQALESYPSLRGPAQAVRTSTLVLSGAEDILVNPEDAAELARLCRGTYRSFPGIGHSLPAEAPRDFELAVLNFVSKL